MTPGDDIDLSGRSALGSAGQSRSPLGGGGGRPSGGGGAPSGEAARRKAEEAVRRRLTELFGKISNALLGRNDEELGGIIEEDKEIMANGLVSLTESFTPLRKPLLVGLNLVEPVLAFGRVAMVLARRWMDRFQSVEEEPLGPPA